MAIYHCSVKIIGRSSGRSAVASAAYRVGEKLKDKETGIIHDYTKKGGVIYREVMLCQNAPKEYQDRETLWNEVQKIEKVSNAQLAREIEVALPIEMSRSEQIQAVQRYVREKFVSAGMCADWALHDKGDGNPHAHIMLTTRPIKANGQWGEKKKSIYKLDENGQKIPVIDPETGRQKVRVRKGKGVEKMWERETVQVNDWNDRSKVEEWRAAWAEICNEYLMDWQQIDHRSYARQGIDQEPTIHEGYVARKMEKNGRVSDRCQINREIAERNGLLKQIKGALREIAEQIKELIKVRGGDLHDRLGELLQRSRDARLNQRVGEEPPGPGETSPGSPGHEEESIRELIRKARAGIDLATAREENSRPGRQNRGAEQELRGTGGVQRTEETIRATSERKSPTPKRRSGPSL